MKNCTNHTPSCSWLWEYDPGPVFSPLLSQQRKKRQGGKHKKHTLNVRIFSTNKWLISWRRKVWDGCDVVLLLLSDGRHWHTSTTNRGQPIHFGLFITLLTIKALSAQQTEIWKSKRSFFFENIRNYNKRLEKCALYGSGFGWSCMTSGESCPQQCLKFHWSWKCLLCKAGSDPSRQMVDNFLDRDWTRFWDFLQTHKQAELRSALEDFPTTNRRWV